MGRADKRARQRENRAVARAAREAALKRERRRKALVRGGIVAALFAGLVVLFNVAGGDDEETPAADRTTTTTTARGAGDRVRCNDREPERGEPQQWDAAPEMQLDPAKTYLADIETSCGEITVLLDAEHAPVATNNFVFLSRNDFYDGLTWHRVVQDFVIQGGDPKGDGTGDPGYSVAGEAPAAGDGYVEGALAAAKGGAEPAGTMGSQFFIVTGERGTALPPDYARFGLVTAGLDVAQKIESFAQDDETPRRPLYIFDVAIREQDRPAATSTTTATTAATTATTTTTPG